MVVDLWFVPRVDPIKLKSASMVMSFFLLIVTTNGVDQQRGAANFVYVYSDGYETDVIPISVKKSRKQDEMSPANQSQSRLRSNECQTTVGIGSFRIFTKEIIIKSVIGN